MDPTDTLQEDLPEKPPRPSPPGEGDPERQERTIPATSKGAAQAGQAPTHLRWADRWLPWVAGVLAVCPYFVLLWPDERVVCGAFDYEFYQLPVHRFVRSELLHGRIPLWMPSLGCGTPLHAAQQAAVAYPLLTPFVLLFPANYGLRLCLFLHAAIGYGGLYLLSRRLGLGRSASAFSALVFTLAAYPIAHVLAGHVNLVCAYGLLPWLFLALGRLLARPGSRAAAGLALVLSLLMLTGHPQLPYHAAVFALLWGLGSLVSGEAAKHRLRVIGWTLVAGLVSVLIVSIQWLPWLELFRDGRPFTPRGNTAFANLAVLRPKHLLLLVFPNAYGNPYAGIPTRPGVPGWWYHEQACYVGLVTLGLIVVGLARRQRYGWQLPILALCGFALVIAMGDKLPLFQLTSTLLPGLTQFRCPGRAAALLCFFAPLLAAPGLEAVLNREQLVGGRWTRPALLFAGLLACGAAGLAFGRVAQSSYFAYVRASLLGPLCRTGLLLLASLVAAATAWLLGRRFPSAGAALLTGVVFLDLYASQAYLIRLGEPNAAEGGAIPAPPGPGRFTVAPADITSLHYSPLVGLLGDGSLSSVVTNEGGVLPASLARLHAQLSDPETRDTMLRLAACDLLYDTEQRTWARLTNGLGRVRLAGELDLRQLRAEGRFLDLSPGKGTVESAHETSQHLVLQVCPESPSLLVVADCYYPGWTAQVDGQTVSVECVHGCFRAVVVPPGAHRVEFAYAPSSFRWGVVGTLSGLLLLALLSLAVPLAGRKRQGGPGIWEAEAPG